jgi:hypothetical protein
LTQNIEKYGVIEYAAATVTRSGEKVSDHGQSPVEVEYAGVIEDGVVVYRNGEGTDLASPVADGIGSDVIVISGPAPVETPAAPVSDEQRYRELLWGGVAAYTAAQEAQEKVRDGYRADLANIDAQLAPLYKNHPYLAPEFLQTVQQGEDLFNLHARHVDLAQDRSVPEKQLQALVDTNPDIRPTHEQCAEIAALTAAASVRKHRGANSYREFRQLLKNPVIDRVAADYVTRNLALFRYYGVNSVGRAELAVYKDVDDNSLDKATLVYRDQLVDALPDDEGARKLVDLQGPPLVITLLATDIRNHNADSVMPDGFATKRPRLSGRPQQFINQTDIIATVVTAHDSYLRRRYRLPQQTRPRVMNALAEIDLAKRQGFSEASTDEQYRTAYRVRNVFKRVKRDQLPVDTQAIFDRCQEINAIPSY